MNLLLSASPFAAKPATASSPSASQPAENTASISTSSSWSHLALLSDKTTGGLHLHHKQHHHTSTPPRSRTRTRTTSSASETASKTHSLQAPSSSSSWTAPKILFRVISLTSAIATLSILPTLRSEGLKNGFGGGLQYLTIIVLVLTAICFCLGLAADLWKKPSLARYKNAMLPVIVPMQGGVAILYWYLTLSNVYNMYPDGNRYIPLWLDIQMHGLPFLFVLVELFFYSETFNVNRIADFTAVTLFIVFYISWSSLCAYIDGEWPYPVLQNIECPWQRLALMLNAGIVGLTIHFIISESHIRTRVIRKAKEVAKSSKATL